MLSSMFVMGAVNSLKNTEIAAQRAKPVADRIVPVIQKAMPSVSVPTDPKTLVRANAGVQILAGLSLATGRAPRLSSLVLATSLVPTTLAGHRFWEETDPATKSNQKVHFFKNLSLLGGLLIAGVDTEGKPGVAWRAKRAASDVRRETKHLRGTARREAKLAAKSFTS